MSTFGQPRHAFDHQTSVGPATDAAAVEALFRRAALAATARAGRLEQSCTEALAAAAPRLVDQVARSLLDSALRTAWEHGWQPIDLVCLTERRGDRPMCRLLVDAIAAESARYSRATVHPRWSEQYTVIGATAWWRTEAPHLPQWIRREGGDERLACRTVARLIGLLTGLPRLNRLLPLPGSARGEEAARGGAVDDKVLARIRALLAKAESTEYADEAEALSAKAQELMTRFSLDRAMVEASGDDETDPAVTARRLWLDAPYVEAKAALVGVVARANYCRAVTYGRLGFVAVLGDEVDLQLVELLATSLFLQANRAMLACDSQRGRTRSFRHSFLVAFAQRIGERLDEARSAAQATVEADVGGGGSARLLPVLAAKKARAEALFQRLFPLTSPAHVSVSNAAGWAAGRVAADQATLDTRSSLPGG